MAVVLAVCGMALVLRPTSGGGVGAPAVIGPGVPTSPSAQTAIDPSLTAHPVAYAPGPLDDPLKGLVPYYAAGSSENTGYPHSLEWSYVGLSEVMTDPTDCNSYNWSALDTMLNEIASYGNQAAIRFYLEFPGGTGTQPADAIPPCFAGNVDERTNTYWGTTSPDYDSPFLLSAFDHFIAAFGARYDGDPRIGFIQVGLVGLWGEWNTWPEDGSGGTPNLMPSAADGARIIDDYANAFHHTQVEVRYPTSGGGAANALDIGYHDDSFCYREGSPLAGVTLPQSMGGANYAQLQLALNEGVENKWVTDSMGGEVRPEIQSTAFSSWPGGSGDVDDMQACIELEHPTWLLDQASQQYSPSDPNVAAAVRLMGYDLSVTDAYYTPDASGTATVGVQIENDGVAPFYYPWTVSLGLEDSSGTVVKTWDTPWDLRTIMPLTIRAFPDWKVGSDPTYLHFGSPQDFQTSVDVSSVPPGTYRWVMRVDNPLSAVSANAKTFRFADATQQSDGWLGLGAVSVQAPVATAPPSPPTGVTASTVGTTSVGLTWTPPSGAVIAGYHVLRDGEVVGISTTPTYTDTGLTPGTSYGYSVEAFTGSGQTSAPSATETVVTTAVSSGGTTGSGTGTGSSGTGSGTGGGQSGGTGVTTTSYEAEASANTLAGGALVAACPSCSGGAKVGYLGNGGTLTVNGVGGSGSANVTVYYASAQARSVELEVDGVSSGSIDVPSTGGWDTVGSTSLSVPLGSGTSHTLTFLNPSGWAPDIDRVTVSAVGSGPDGGSGTGSGGAGNGGAGGSGTGGGGTGTGAGSGATTTSYEAESSANTLAGGALVAACPSCSGAAKVGYIGEGGTITFEGVTGTGPATVTIYYATAMDRTGDLSVDGGPSSSIDFPATAGWDAVGSTSVTVDLSAGSNTLELANPTGWAPDVDRITVTPNS